MLRKMGEQCEVNHVHPHKFRRTMATTAIDRVMLNWHIRNITSGWYVYRTSGAEEKEVEK